jgi:hypothetical protein
MRNMIVVTSAVFCFVVAAAAVQQAPQKPDSLVKVKDARKTDSLATAVPAAVPAASAKQAAQKPDSLGKAKDSTAAPRTAFGRIAVTSIPEQAEVSVDSVAKGACPVTIDSLQQGMHVLIVRKKGYFGKKITVKVPPDSTVTVAVSLVKPGRLVLKSDPDQARVFLDGKEAGTTPYENATLKPGSHTVRCEKDSYAPFEKQLVVAEGSDDTLSVALSPVREPQQEAKKAPAPAKKSSFDKVTTAIVAGLFAVFGIILFSIEIEETSK